MKQNTKNQSIAEIISRRRENVLVRQDGVSLLLRILFFTLAVWFLFTRVFFITQASGCLLYTSRCV